MRTKHRTNFRSLFASTESAGLPPVDSEALNTDAPVVEPTTAPAESVVTDVPPTTTEVTPEEIDTEIAETNEAELAVDETVAVAEGELEETERAVEINEGFVDEAQTALEEDNLEQVTATIDASNEALQILLGTNQYDVKSVSFESFSNERVRNTMARISMEAMEERSGNLLQRAWEAIKKMIRAAMDFIEDLVNRFRNQEKRLTKLKGELSKLDGKQRIVVKHQGLAKRLVIHGEGGTSSKNGVSTIMESMDALNASTGIMRERMEKLNAFYQSIFTKDYDRSYDALVAALSKSPFYKKDKNRQLSSFAGGLTVITDLKDNLKKGEDVDRDVKYIYKFEQAETQADPEVTLPTVEETIKLIDNVLSSYSKLKGEVDKLKSDMKLGETRFGALVKGFKASRENEDSASKRKDRIKAALKINGIYNRAFLRPVGDLMKIAAFQLQTTAMLATAVVRSQRGENADETTASTESFTSTVSDDAVDNLQTESSVDYTQVDSDSDVKEYEDSTLEEANAEIAETNAAEDEVDAVVAEAEDEIDEVHEVAEVNEEFVQEAQKAAEEGDFEQVTATIDASNEALRILTGTDKYDIKGISLENYSNERVRATMLRVSLEAMEERSGNLMQRAWEAIKKMIRAAMDFIVDLIDRFRNQEKRLEKIRVELKDLKSSQRLVAKNKSLANRMVAEGKVQGISGVVETLKAMPKALEVMEKRLKNLNEFYKNSLTANSDRSYAALVKALGMNPGTPLTSQATDTANFIGGFTMVNRFKSVAAQVDYTYEFSHTTPTGAGEDIVLPTPAEMYQVAGVVLENYKSVKTKADEIKRAYKLSEGALGAAYKAGKAVAKAGGDMSTGVDRGTQAAGINRIYNKAFIRPVIDLLKVAAYQLQTTAMVGVTVVRAHRGENVDDASTTFSAESFNGTVADGTVDKLRSESPEDDTQVASDSGTTKDEGITPAVDDEVNEHKEESTVTPKEMTIEEFEDTNAAEVAESLEDITAALEDLEQREGALDDTIQAIEILEDAEGEGGLNSAGAALLNLSAESVNRLMGFKDMPQVTASVESYQTVSGRRMANAASMESFKERAMEIIKKLKNALKMIWDWIKHMASRFYEMIVSAEKRADAILAKLKTVQQTPQGEITNAQVLKMIATRQGTMDATSIGRSLERSKSLLEISATLGDSLLERAMASAEDLNQRVNFGAECAKIASAEFNKAIPEGQLHGLLGGQQLQVFIDDKVGLVRVTLGNDDSVKPAKSVKYFSVQDSVKIVEGAKSVLTSARKNKAITEKGLDQLGRFMKSNPKVDEAKDQNGGVFLQWSSDVQKNTRGVTQLIAQTFKAVKYSVDAALRVASYTAGVKEKKEPAQADAPTSQPLQLEG